MKKKALVLLISGTLMMCCGCGNKQLIDTVQRFERFEYAYIYLPDGQVIEGAVESWRDFEDGNQLQIKIDGKTYLTHAANVVLIHERKEK